MTQPHTDYRLEERASTSRPTLTHTYPTPNGRDPRPGDVALCGYVKTDPHRYGKNDPPLDCVVCAELEAA